jgi:predicted PurR-regulated permease PerM
MSNTKLWAISLFGLVVGWILFRAAGALQPVLIAVIVAYLLNPAVVYIQKRFQWKKGLAIAFVLIMMVVLVGLLGTLILPPVINQATVFVKEFQTYGENLQQLTGKLEGFLVQRGLSGKLFDNLDQIILQLYNVAANFLLNLITSMLGYIIKAVDGLIIAVLVCYFLSSGKEMVEGSVKQAPQVLQKPLQNLIQGTDHVIWTYIKTQFIIALVIGSISTLAFILIGVRFSFLLGLMAGILNLIPYFGSMIAGVLAALVALLTAGIKQTIIVGIAVLIIQQVEGNLITPRLQGKSSGMHPAWIIVALLICNYFWGTIGMFIAVPVAGLVKLVLQESILLIRNIN